MQQAQRVGLQLNEQYVRDQVMDQMECARRRRRVRIYVLLRTYSRTQLGARCDACESRDILLVTSSFDENAIVRRTYVCDRPGRSFLCEFNFD